MNQKKIELFVGSFVLAGLLILAFMLIQFGRFGGDIKDGYMVSVEFNDATGVIEGGEVRMGGAVVGKVARKPVLKTDATGVKVDLTIQKGVKIPANSTFQVASLNFLGDRYIEVKPPLIRDERFLEPGDVIQGKDEGGLAAIQQQAENLSDQAVTTLQRLDTSLERVDLVLQDMSNATQNISEITDKINRELLAKETLENIRKIIDDAEGFMANLKASSDKIDPLVVKTESFIDQISTTEAELRETLRDTRQAISNANQRIEELAPAFEEVPETIKELRATLAKAGQTLDQFDANEGLLGALTKDKQLEADAREFMTNLRKYGILRYRDPEGQDQEFPDRPRTRRR